MTTLTYDWYRLFNLTDFDNTYLNSYEFEVVLKGIGLRTVLITKGNGTSILVDDTLLMIGLNDKNPFRFGTRAVYLDANSDVWLGVEVAD